MQRNKIRLRIIILWLLTPLTSHASYIETTMGTAVVNDATASYHNPAALVLLKNPQIIPIGTIARFNTEFSGQATSVATGFTQSGTASSTSTYYSPSLYFGLPINERVTFGLAAIANFANRDPEENAILRYVQSSNTIQDYDLVPSIGIKINDMFAVGMGVNFSYTSLNLRPIVGFPGTNIADGQATNQSDGSGIGANVGFLLRPAKGTLIGFDYRTTTNYKENGTSVFDGTSRIVSNDYHFELRTPPRSVLSLSQMITPEWGVITTIQRIQWSIIRNINVSGIATTTALRPVIVNASIPQYLHDTWVLTVGGNYRFKPHWIIRAAGTYNQSPSNGYYQVSTGDSFILGTSMGYEINKAITLDIGYAHAFLQDQKINIQGNRFLVNGNNRGSRDVVTLKLTLNV